MKAMAAALLVAIAVCAACSAQAIKRIDQCRAYREAWHSSADQDTQHLPVKELVQRAEQMIVCGKEIDAKPVEATMTPSEAVTAVIGHVGYAALAAFYYKEAFNRAAWFIDNKKLTAEFIANEKTGKIARPKSSSSK